MNKVKRGRERENIRNTWRRTRVREKEKEQAKKKKDYPIILGAV